MSTRQVLEAFQRWREAGRRMVLVTVVSTEGSTYTKAGHRILLNDQGEYQGLVSGGCLEGDLAEHARSVLSGGESTVLTYDLRDENDELFGLGIGCNGLFRVLLQPLLPERDYVPFNVIARRLLADKHCGIAVVVESTDDATPIGATVVADATSGDFTGVPPAWREILLQRCRSQGISSRAICREESVGLSKALVLYAPLPPLPHLLVLGAGLDAVPLVNMARQAGWRITVADHRAAYLARGDLGNADRLLEVAAAGLAGALDLAAFDAAVVMSHHLASDRLYLQALSMAPVPYIGLLGPVARRDRLLTELGEAGKALGTRLHAPAGLDISADSPETIALAILAQIHATLASSPA